MSQASVVDAHIHPLMKGFDGREHRQDLPLFGQVTPIGDHGAIVPGTLTLSS